MQGTVLVLVADILLGAHIFVFMLKTLLSANTFVTAAIGIGCFGDYLRNAAGANTATTTSATGLRILVISIER